MTLAQECLIALGGNLPTDQGGPQVTLRAALARLADHGITVTATSRFYETPCFPVGAGPDYVNAAACLRFDGIASDILGILHEVEAEFGREREQRWGRRTLDLDLIAVGDTVLPDASTQAHWRDLPVDRQVREAPGELILPHPRLQDRAFVLVPLNDIAPDWVHPLLRQSVTQMLARLPEDDVRCVRAL